MKQEHCEWPPWIAFQRLPAETRVRPSCFPLTRPRLRQTGSNQNWFVRYIWIDVKLDHAFLKEAPLRTPLFICCHPHSRALTFKCMQGIKLCHHEHSFRSASLSLRMIVFLLLLLAVGFSTETSGALFLPQFPGHTKTRPVRAREQALIGSDDFR